MDTPACAATSYTVGFLANFPPEFVCESVVKSPFWHAENYSGAGLKNFSYALTVAEHQVNVD